MKTTIDDVVVPDRCWYYLLDFNDRDHWKTMSEKFDKMRLCDLESHEFWDLFQSATEQDLNLYSEQIPIELFRNFIRTNHLSSQWDEYVKENQIKP
jgi:hypothetical protein